MCPPSSAAKKLGVSEVSLEVVNFISHATESRLRSLLEKVSAVAQHRTDVVKVCKYTHTHTQNLVRFVCVYVQKKKKLLYIALL